MSSEAYPEAPLEQAAQPSRSTPDVEYRIRATRHTRGRHRGIHIPGGGRAIRAWSRVGIRHGFPHAGGELSGVANDASYYGAPGDLSSIWQGGECMCQAGTGSGTGNCTAPPSCPMEQDCGKCVAVKCDPNGTISEGGYTHDQYCSSTEYVVIEVIDACPHNHPTNEASSEGWCTSTQANHIDLSCSALGGISNLGTDIGEQGWLNVDVQVVPCSLGLGLHSL